MTKRLKARWAFARTKPSEELDWQRTEEFKHIEVPRPLVLVNGSYDLLHAGHLRLFYHARKKAGEKGAVLLALDSDELVASKKGPNRPIMTWPERAAALHWLVDYIVEVNSDKEFLKLVGLVKPDLRVQGGDYLGKPSRIPTIPALIVPDRGIRSSEIIERIVARYR